MIQVEPATLEFNGVRLEPLSLAHVEGLRAAALDGALWNLRVTSVPEPHRTQAYVHTALETPDRVPFAVVDVVERRRCWARPATTIFCLPSTGSRSATPGTPNASSAAT